LIWRMHLSRRLVTFVSLMEKVGKAPKDRLCRKELGMDAAATTEFMLLVMEFMDRFLEVRQTRTLTLCCRCLSGMVHWTSVSVIFMNTWIDNRQSQGQVNRFFCHVIHRSKQPRNRYNYIMKSLFFILKSKQLCVSIHSIYGFAYPFHKICGPFTDPYLYHLF